MTQLSLYLWLSTCKVSIRSVTSVSVSLTSVKCDTHTSSLAPALAKFISTIAQPHPHPKSWTWMSTLQRVPSVLHWQSAHTLPGFLHLLCCQQYWRDSLECAATHSSSTSQSDGLIPPSILQLRCRPNSAKAEVPFLHHMLIKGPLAPCLQRPLVIWLDVRDQTLQCLVIPEQHTWGCWGIWCGEKNASLFWFAWANWILSRILLLRLAVSGPGPSRRGGCCSWGTDGWSRTSPEWKESSPNPSCSTCLPWGWSTRRSACPFQVLTGSQAWSAWPEPGRDWFET